MSEEWIKYKKNPRQGESFGFVCTLLHGHLGPEGCFAPSIKAMQWLQAQKLIKLGGDGGKEARGIRRTRGGNCGAQEGGSRV